MRKITKLFIAAIASSMLCAALFSGCASTQQSDESSSSQDASVEVSEEVSAAADALRIGSLKGPTSIGLASMMDQEQGVFTIAATADEIAPELLRDELDIALVPANLASTLYNNSDGQIQVIDINTLGVLFAVTGADVSNVEDLKGRTVYMTGKGSVPEYTLLALLKAKGMSADDIDLQFRSEPSEVVALISSDKDSVGILPQPYATSATIKDDSLKEVIDLTQAWDEATGGQSGTFITGVTIAKKSFVEQNKEVIDEFLRRHALSVEEAESDPAAIASKVVSLGIIDNEQIAEKAIPNCNVVFMAGDEMKEALSGFLTVLQEQDEASVGGALPGDDFYYIQ